MAKSEAMRWDAQALCVPEPGFLPESERKALLFWLLKRQNRSAVRFCRLEQKAGLVLLDVRAERPAYESPLQQVMLAALQSLLSTMEPVSCCAAPV